MCITKLYRVSYSILIRSELEITQCTMRHPVFFCPVLQGRLKVPCRPRLLMMTSIIIGVRRWQFINDTRLLTTTSIICYGGRPSSVNPTELYRLRLQIPVSIHPPLSSSFISLEKNGPPSIKDSTVPHFFFQPPNGARVWTMQLLIRQKNKERGKWQWPFNGRFAESHWFMFRHWFLAKVTLELRSLFSVQLLR